MQGNTCVRLSPSPGGEGGWSAYMILVVALRAVRLLALFSKSVTLAVFAALARGLCLGPPLGECIRHTARLFEASFEAGVLLAFAAGILRVPALRHSVLTTLFTVKSTLVFRKLCVLVFVQRVAAWLFLSPVGLPAHTPRGARCAAFSKDRRRPCCAVQ